jgi:hypothetical protein
MDVHLSRTFWIKCARWGLTLLVLPLAWYGGLWLEGFLHGHAVALWCAKDQVDGNCPSAAFEPIATGVFIVSGMLASLLTVLGTFALAPEWRLEAMWAAFAFIAAVAFMLGGPVPSFPVIVVPAFVCALLTWVTRRNERPAFQVTHPPEPDILLLDGADGAPDATPHDDPDDEADDKGGHDEERPTAMTPSTTTTTGAAPPQLRTVILETGADGRARFRDEAIALSAGTPMARLSPLARSGGYQWRESPVGFRSEFHCTNDPQWLVVLQGAMEIGLQDGTSRVFRAGEHFYSNDTLPPGAVFDPGLHGHWSRQVGEAPLVTLFVRT